MRRAEKWHDLAPRRADGWRAQALELELAHAKPLQVRAQRGVVLTTGGFIFNREMVARIKPRRSIEVRPSRSTKQPLTMSS